jgi:uridine phosphorylase
MDKEKEHIKDFDDFVGRVHQRILLHHSYDKLREITDCLKSQGLITKFTELYNEDFPMIDINYKDSQVTLVTTRMGVDLSLWCVDKLAQWGAKYFLKLGTFVALNDEIQRGDVYVPDNAIVLHGPLNAYLGEGVTSVCASESLTRMIHAKDNSVNRGTVLTYPVCQMKTKDNVYNPYEYIPNCFGLEMECAAVFAAAQFRNAQSAAILICNRDFPTLEGRTSGWRINREDPKYHDAYDKTINLALETLIEVGDIK